MSFLSAWMDLPFFWPAAAGLVVLITLTLWLIFRYLRLHLTHRQLIKSATERLARDQKEIARLSTTIQTLQDDLALKKQEITRLSTTDQATEELFHELEIRLVAEDHLTTHAPDLLPHWEEAKNHARQKIQGSSGWKKWWKKLTRVT
jgi:hypothetical protein